MRKRLFAYFLCVCMVLTLLPCTAFAVSDEMGGWCGALPNTNDVHWALSQNTSGGGLTLTIRSYKSPAAMADFSEFKDSSSKTNLPPWFSKKSEITKVVIDDTDAPSNGPHVSHIGDYAFSELTSLRTVELNGSVSTIGKYAFQGCESLVSIKLPASVTSIGRGAFQSCKSLVTVDFEYPRAFNTISEDLFLGCEKLENVFVAPARNNLLDDITTVGPRAFNNCFALSEIKLPDCTNIGDSAFRGCKGLTTVSIPKIAAMGDDAFKDCVLLSSVTLRSNVDGVGYINKIPDGAFENCAALKDVKIPWAVQEIGKRAFAGTSLGSENSFEIPDQVLTIGEYAFGELKDSAKIRVTVKTNLGLVTPEVTRTYGTGVFRGSELDEITFEVGLQNISAGLLDGCTVHKVNISRTINTIDPNAFINCSGIEQFTVNRNSDNSYSTFRSPNGVLYTYAMDELVRYPDSADAALGVNYVIPNTVETIRKNAFYGCTTLTKVTFPANPPKTPLVIGEAAFKNSSLSEVDISERVTSIGKSAFENTDLTEIVIPKSVKDANLGEAAFKDCGSLTDVTLSNNLTKINASTFENSGVTSIRMPDILDEIGPSAFQNCKALVSLTLNPRLTKIGDFAFQGCYNLTELVLHEALVSIGNSAFENCTNLYGETDTPNVLRIPTTVTSIGNRAFKGCSAGLVKVDMTGGGTAGTTLGDSVFEDCSSLTTVTLSNRITAIGEGAFMNDKRLEPFALPNKLPTISRNMFRNCLALTEMVIPNETTTIGSGAFAYSGIKMITLHKDLKTIDGDRNPVHAPGATPVGAFLESNLETIGFSGTQNEWDTWVDAPTTKIYDNSIVFTAALRNVVCIKKTVPTSKGYTATFLLNGGSTFDSKLANLDFPEGYKPDDPDSVPPVLKLTLDQIPYTEQEGYTFQGWQLYNDSKVYTSEELTSLPITEDVLLTAVWEEIPVPTYQVLTHNGAEASPSEAEAGELITLTVSTARNETFLNWNIRPSIREADFYDDYDETSQTTYFYMPAYDISVTPVIEKNSEIISTSKEYLVNKGITGDYGYTEEKIRKALSDYFSKMGYDSNNSYFEIIITEVMKEQPAEEETTEKDTPEEGTDEELTPVAYTVDNTGTRQADLSLAFAAESSEDDKIDVIIPFPDGTSPKTHTYKVAVFNPGTEEGESLQFELVTTGEKQGIKVRVSASAKVAVNSTPIPQKPTTSSGYSKQNSITQAIGSYSASTIASTLRGGFDNTYTTQLYQIIKDDPDNTSTISVPLSYPSGTNKDNYSFSAYAFNKNTGGRRSITVSPSSSSLLVEVTEANTAICIGAKKKSTSSNNNNNNNTTTDKTYTIRDDSGKGGTVRVAEEAVAGDTVNITVNPKDGYELDDITVYNTSTKKSISVKEGSRDNRFTFKMPSSKVTVEATFVEVDDNSSSSKTNTSSQNQTLMTAAQLFGPGVSGVAGIPDVVSGGTSTTASTVPKGTTVVNAQIPFTDVANNSEYRTAVGYVYSKGLMAGTNATTFSPDTTVSRAMVVSILHRLEGSPSAEKTSFEDVEEGEWFETPIAWASSNGIVSGYTGDNENKFGPTDPVTKEQLVSILARYALLKKYDTVARADISEYKDADNVSQYALGAMQWAAGKELFAENSLNLLSPTKDLNRAETADMLMRFCQNVAKIQ